MVAEETLLPFIFSSTSGNFSEPAACSEHPCQMGKRVVFCRNKKHSRILSEKISGFPAEKGWWGTIRTWQTGRAVIKNRYGVAICATPVLLWTHAHSERGGVLDCTLFISWLPNKKRERCSFQQHRSLCTLITEYRKSQPVVSRSRHPKERFHLHALTCTYMHIHTYHRTTKSVI